MKKVFSKVYLGLIFLFLYAPLIVMVLISFNSGDSTTQMEGFSLKWYREIFRDHGTLQAFRNTLVLSVLAAVLVLLIVYNFTDSADDRRERAIEKANLRRARRLRKERGELVEE